jgi:hypothetical protein
MKDSKKEDYLFEATISTDTLQIDNVRCKLYLPVRLTDPLSLTFHLSDEQERVLRNKLVWKFSLQGELKQADNCGTKINAENVFTSEINSTLCGPELWESLLIAKLEDLEITNYWSSRVDKNAQKISGRFWLTPNDLLAPAQMIKNSYTGDVTVETVWYITFPFSEGMLLTFSNCYKYQKDEAGDTISFHELVAEFDIAGNNIDSVKLRNEYLNRIDNLLRFVSLASRHRCVCLGFDFSTTSAYTQYYRRDITIPKVREPHITELIDKADIKEFLEKTYNRFIELRCNELLWQALNYAIPDRSRTVESSFISLYSALETLVLYFRRTHHLEIVFSENETDQWYQLQSDLKQWLKTHSLLKDNKVRRKLIYENLSSLQRISFPTAFRECCKAYSLDLTDLWPVVDNTEGWSLSKIRNKLVHGEHLSRPKSRAVLAAREHLQWIVERLILSIFEWDILRSSVCPAGLSHIVQYQGWKADRESLSS